MKTLRDVFWTEIYNRALADKDIVIVCADMGAPALDQFKEKLPGQFVNVGVAEQNAVAVSSGLALNGKKVFAYAIAPFITYRCYEQTKVMLSGMSLPVSLVGVGAGFSYDDSGPTHHTVEDISVMRILPNMTIYSPSCENQIKHIVDMACTSKAPNYIRLDRAAAPFNAYGDKQDFSKGFAIPKDLADINIICTGNMLYNALEASEALAKLGLKSGVVDVFTIPCKSPELIEVLNKSSKVFTLEEHSLTGGFGSYILELANDNGCKADIKRIGVDFTGGYCYTYGGRANIQKKYGLDVQSIVDKIKNS